MLRFIVRRLLWTIPVLFTILVIVFLLMHAMPGGPWDGDSQGAKAMTNLGMDATTLKALYRRYGLDDPLWKQFTSYLVGRTDADGQFICGLVCGNLGPSYRSAGRTVQDILFNPPKNKTIFESRFGYSIRLSLYAFTLALVVGLPLGILAAVNQGRWLDYAIKTFATLLISMPNFVIGLLIIILLSGNLNLILVAPTTWDRFDLRAWGAPVLILSLGAMAALIRLTRASLLDVMRRDYVRTARGKGASEGRIVSRHMLKNALMPVITFCGPALLELFAGSFVVETMYGYPGMGRQYIESALSRDYSMIMGVTLVYALLIAGVNALVDLLYGALDPRVHVEG